MCFISSDELFNLIFNITTFPNDRLTIPTEYDADDDDNKDTKKAEFCFPKRQNNTEYVTN